MMMYNVVSEKDLKLRQVSVCVSADACVCVHLEVSFCIHVMYMHVLLHVHVCICMCTCVCVCVCLCVVYYYLGEKDLEYILFFTSRSLQGLKLIGLKDSVYWFAWSALPVHVCCMWRSHGIPSYDVLHAHALYMYMQGNDWSDNSFPVNLCAHDNWSVST